METSKQYGNMVIMIVISQSDSIEIHVYIFIILFDKKKNVSEKKDF